MPEESLRDERLKKLSHLREKNIDAYPAEVRRDFTLGQARQKFEALADKEISLSGRIMSVRDQGNIVFIDLKDDSGSLQAVLKSESLPDMDFWKANLDRGDFISVHGKLFTTNRGEKSLEAKELKLLTKALRPIPSEHFGVEDVETRLRKRYLDLLANPESKELFKKKSVFWQSTRDYLLKAGFLEVETPILESIPGGAEAEPFVTHHNALDTDFYLRISPELNLKRLIVGGFDKVFEIGRIFRNEGIDAEHLQDYTQMELYWAYQDYKGLMKFVEKLTKHVIKKTFGTTVIVHKGQEVDWAKKWVKYDYYSLFKEHAGLNLKNASREKLWAQAKELGLEHIENDVSRGRLIDLIYKKTVRPHLIQPGFLINPPVDIEPLAKRWPKDMGRVERFQPVAYGTELGKGFTELNDPLDQRERFEEQEKARAAGDKEAQRLDEDYLEAMEYGMPPTAGFAYSERLFAVLADKPIRETVFFPLMRRKKEDA